MQTQLTAFVERFDLFFDLLEPESKVSDVNGNRLSVLGVPAFFDIQENSSKFNGHESFDGCKTEISR